MKILLAADGSKYTKRAVEYLVNHFDTLDAGSEIHLLHVQTPLPGRAAAALSASIIRDYYRDASRKALAPTRRLLRQKLARYREFLVVGDPGAVIAARAKRGNYDLVVMGSRGHGALAGLILGSVVSKVLANCAVPMLIIR
jgi:nucleotide-binding universal stress UspA family protein